MVSSHNHRNAVRETGHRMVDIPSVLEAKRPGNHELRRVMGCRNSTRISVWYKDRRVKDIAYVPVSDLHKIQSYQFSFRVVDDQWREDKSCKMCISLPSPRQEKARGPVEWRDNTEGEKSIQLENFPNHPQCFGHRIWPYFHTRILPGAGVMSY